MTREEAIEVLKDCELNPCVPKDKEAVNMAIKALEQEPCCNCIEFKRYAKVMGFEIEQEPKSEWEQDHEILKAYSDGVSEVLEKIRTEIEFEVDHRTNMLCAEDVFEIIDKYKGESEG